MRGLGTDDEMFGGGCEGGGGMSGGGPGGTPNLPRGGGEPWLKRKEVGGQRTLVLQVEVLGEPNDPHFVVACSLSLDLPLSHSVKGRQVQRIIRC